MFEKIFTQITPEEIGDKFNIFKLVGKDYFAVTAGTHEHYNSMVGSGGGFGVHFKKPTVWCILRSDRYTVELIEKHQSYTFSFSRISIKSNCFFWEVNRGGIVIKCRRPN